jgi:mono/diheme cytochrome c family protein/rhodanese-related sulfurtransferase
VPQTQGSQLYARYCALCHGANGEGYAADNATRLRGQGFLRTATDDFLLKAIKGGRLDTAMAAYGHDLGGPLTDPQIQAIVEHIRAWQEGPRIDVAATRVHGDADRGATVYSERCARCHGTLGEGRNAQSLSDALFLETASDGYLRYAIVHGRERTRMPAFQNVLSPQQIDDLVAFVRRLTTQPQTVPQNLQPPPIATVPLMRYPNGPRPNFTLREERFVPAAQVRDAVARHSRLIVLDARPTSEWLRRRIPGALPVPYYDIEPIIARLPRDGTWIVAYCGCPHAASGAVVDALRMAHFDHTAVIDEGIHYWIHEAYPTESGPLTSP